MLSKEAEQSIKRFKSFSVFMSSMYESPGNMSKSKRRFFRWFINLQGIFGPKAEGTIKEEISLDGIVFSISLRCSFKELITLAFKDA